MKLKLQKLFDTLGMSYGQIATAVSQMSGEPITSDLISQAASGLPVTAKHADALCKWLSQQFGREFQPTDIADMKVHPASALPEKANTAESATLRNEKIEGFVAGFNLAYAARFNHKTLSNEEAHHFSRSGNLQTSDFPGERRATPCCELCSSVSTCLRVCWQCCNGNV